MAIFKAADIADFYIQLANGIDDTIDNLKLNKLLYYAQGWSLARGGDPIFSDEVEAWDYGPVIPDVYRTYKVCGKNPILEPKDHFDESLLSSEQLCLLTDVYANFGQFTGVYLKELTHRRGTPWSKVYENGKNNLITKEALKGYFSNNEQPKSFNIDLDNVEIISAVPEEWDSELDKVYDKA